jgi:hypothetical protein
MFVSDVDSSQKFLDGNNRQFSVKQSSTVFASEHIFSCSMIGVLVNGSDGAQLALGCQS